MSPGVSGILKKLSLILALLLEGSAIAAEPLTRISEIRSLSREAAAQAQIVRVRGVVTWCTTGDAFAVQDDSGGTWVNIAGARQRLIWAGDDALGKNLHDGLEVEVEGVSHASGYSPSILPRTIRILGEKPLPVARPLDRARFLSGVEAGQRIEARGIVLGFSPMNDGWRLRVQSGPDTLLVLLFKDVIRDPTAILNAEVTVRGTAGSGFNTRGEFVGALILVSIADGLVVDKTTAPSPLLPPLVPLDQLRVFRHEPVKTSRVRIQGTVTFALPGEFYYVQEGTRAVRVDTRSAVSLSIGDRVEADGYVNMARFVGGLGGADIRKIGVGLAPKPVIISPEEIMVLNAVAAEAGQAAEPHDFDGHLIRFRAQLLAVQSAPEGKPAWRRLTLKHENMILGAILHQGDAAALDAMQPDSELEVTGIAQLEFGVAEGGRVFLRPVRMDVALRSAADVVVVRAPSWWTAGRLLALLAVGALLLGGALVWAWQLRRQVRRKTQDLAKEMSARRDAAVEFQATTRERNRLAANLHDTLLQTMGGIGFQLEACDAEAAAPRQVGALVTHMEVARRMLDHAVDELRGSVWALRSLPMQGLTLPQVLSSLAERAGAGHEARIEVRTEGDLSHVPDFVAGNLLLAAQEALHNALKHGRSHTVTLEARPADKTGWIVLVVRDDGVGFEPGTQAGPSQGHFGLAGMRERMERLDGTLRIESVPGQGTTLTLEVPLRSYDEDVA